MTAFIEIRRLNQYSGVIRAVEEDTGEIHSCRFYRRLNQRSERLYNVAGSAALLQEVLRAWNGTDSGFVLTIY